MAENGVSLAHCASTPDEISLLDLLIVIAQRKRLIVSVTAMAAVGSLIVSLLLPVRYTSTARMLPPQQNQSAASAIFGQLGSLGALSGIAGVGKDLGLRNPSDLYVALLKSRTVEDALIDRFDLTAVYDETRRSDARKELENRSVITASKDGIISISVEDRDRKRAAEMANAYVEELRRLTQRIAITEASQRRLFFEQHLADAKSELASAEQALKETQQKSGLISLDAQSKAIIESVAAVQASIAAKEVEVQAMRSFATDRHPRMILALEELEGLRRQLRKLEVQKNAGNGDILVPTSKAPELGIEYLRRLRELKYREIMFEALAKQYEIARLDEAKNNAIVQVVDEAVEPDKKSSPPRTLIVLVTVVVGFLGSVTCVLAAHGVRCLGESPKELQRIRLLIASLSSPMWSTTRRNT